MDQETAASESTQHESKTRFSKSVPWLCRKMERCTIINTCSIFYYVNYTGAKHIWQTWH